MTSGDQTIADIKTFSGATILNSTLSVSENSIFNSNVGIGIANPGAKLHVNGDANINNIELKKWNNSNVDREIHGPTSGNFLIRSNDDKALYLGGQDIKKKTTKKTKKKSKRTT